MILIKLLSKLIECIKMSKQSAKYDLIVNISKNIFIFKKILNYCLYYVKYYYSLNHFYYFCRELHRL